MPGEGVVEQGDTFSGRVKPTKCLNVYAIIKSGNMTYWNEKITLSNQTEITTQEYVIKLIEQEIRRADATAPGIRIVASPPNPIGILDFTIYFLDEQKNSKIKNARGRGASREASKYPLKEEEVNLMGYTDYYVRVNQGKRNYTRRLSEVYLKPFQRITNHEKRAFALARMGAHELAHQITELADEIDGKSGLDPDPQVIGPQDEKGLHDGPIEFPRGKQLSLFLIARMSERIQELKEME